MANYLVTYTANIMGEDARLTPVPDQQLCIRGVPDFAFADGLLPGRMSWKLHEITDHRELTDAEADALVGVRTFDERPKPSESSI